MFRFILTTIFLISLFAGKCFAYTSAFTGAEVEQAVTNSINVQVVDYAELKLVTGSIDGEQCLVAYRAMANDGGGGIFNWLAGDQSANPLVTADPSEGIYVKPTTPGDGSTGVWTRQDIGHVNAAGFGALVANSVATNSAIVQAAIDSLVPTGGEILIPYGIQWDLSLITLKDEIQIIDNSGYDFDNADTTGQLKHILKTASPGTKNAHEFQIMADWHPALILDNRGDTAAEQRASIVFRQNGNSSWVIGKGATNLDQNFRIASFSGGETNVLEIDETTKGFGINAKPVTGIALLVAPNAVEGSRIRLFSKTTNYGEIQHESQANGIGVRIRLDETLNEMSLIQGGSKRIIFDANNAIKGYKTAVEAKTGSFSVGVADSNKLFTDEGAAGGFIINLPAATVGIVYDFIVVDGNNMRVTPNGTDNFRGMVASKYKESAVTGERLQLVCAKAGVWDFVEPSGAWTNQP